MKVSQVFSLHEQGKRAYQQDNIWIGSHVFAVCDGVGGGNSGEIASKFLSETLGNSLGSMDPNEITSKHIEASVSEALEKMDAYVAADPKAKSMATTLTLVIVKEKSLLIAWCGDSRVYVFRSGQIQYRTVDHSQVAYLVSIGEITEEEARTHHQKNIITKSVQAGKSLPEISFYEFNQLQEGDWFFQCTDGVLEQWTDQALTEVFSSSTSPHQLILNKSVNQTQDNFSCIMGQIGFTSEPPLPAYSIPTQQINTLPMEQNTKPKNYNWAIVLIVILMAAGIAAICVMYTQKKSSLISPTKSHWAYFPQKLPKG